MRYTQPQSGPARVDWSNRLTIGLALAASGGQILFDAATGRTAVQNGTVKSYNPKGAGYSAVANSSIGAKFSGSKVSTSNGVGTGSFTYIVLAAPVASSTREFFVCNADGSAEFYFGANHNVGLTATPGAVCAQTNSGGASGVTAAGAADGAPHVYGYSRDTVSGIGSLYVDGTLAASNVVSAAAIWSSASSDYIAGYSGAGWGAVECVGLVLGFNRALTATEHKAIAANPWQLFASPRRILKAASSVPTLSAAFMSGITSSGGYPQVTRA